MNNAFRITRPAMHSVVLPAAIIAAYHPFSWATVVVPTNGLTVNDHVTIVPMYATEKEESRKAYTGRPINVAIVMIAYVVTPAYRGSNMPPVAIHHMGVVIRHIYDFSLARLDVNDVSTVFMLCFNFNIVVGY